MPISGLFSLRHLISSRRLAVSPPPHRLLAAEAAPERRRRLRRRWRRCRQRLWTRTAPSPQRPRWCRRRRRRPQWRIQWRRGWQRGDGRRRRHCPHGVQSQLRVRRWHLLTAGSAGNTQRKFEANQVSINHQATKQRRNNLEP